MFKFQCPQCQQRISAGEDPSGTSVQCPACTANFVVSAVTYTSEMETTSSPESAAESPSPSEEQAEAAKPESGTSHSLAERLKERNKVAKEGAKALKEGAMVGWAGVKRRSKQAALRAQIEKIKNIDLRKAYHSLGQRAFEQGGLSGELSDHFQTIQDLDSKIAGLREKGTAEKGETKMATLKRVSKDTAKAGQAQALTVKREHSITELGRAIHAHKDQINAQDLNEEIAAISNIEHQIQEIEEQIRALDDGGKSKTQTIAVAAMIVLFLIAGALFLPNLFGNGGRRARSVNAEGSGEDGSYQAHSGRNLLSWGQKATTDLRKWRVAGVHLGMSKSEVESSLGESLNVDVTLKEIKCSNPFLQCYQIADNASLQNLKYATNYFYFDKGKKLSKVALDMEIVAMASNLKFMSPIEFGKQAMNQYQLDELEATSIPIEGGTEGRGTLTEYEAIVPSGPNDVIIAISKRDWSAYGGRKSGGAVSLALVPRLSFGDRGSVFGLKFGMSQDEVVLILKNLFGSQTKLIPSEHVDNQNLEDGVIAYDIMTGVQTQGTAHRSFVVFDKTKKLSDIHLNKDQLGQAFPFYDNYGPSNFARIFMRNFGVTNMKVNSNASEINCTYSDADYYFLVNYGAYSKHSVFVMKKRNKTNF